MEQKFLERLQKMYDDAKANSNVVPKLLELQKEFNRTFADQIESVSKLESIIKKVKVPITWRYMISAPFIYGMIFPALLWNLGIEIYHQVCFRLYGIPRVQSKEYFVYDRQLLNLLNFWEKINCIYCSYVNNLIRYSAEIGGRTERYWCPIKYYRRIAGAHSQYDKFVDIKDKKELHEKWEELKDFSDVKE